MSKDRLQGNDQARIAAHWLDLIKRNPAEAAKYVTFNPKQKEMLAKLARKTYSQEISRAKNDRTWLPTLFSRFLPPEEPAVVVSLFSGESDELLHLRTQYPTARMVAIDNSKDPSVIRAALVHSLVTGTELIHRDVQHVRPDNVFRKQRSHLVIRHPGPLVGDAAQQLPAAIASWSRDAVSVGGHVLVTSYTQSESASIADAIKREGLHPQLHTFEGGEDIYAKAGTNNYPHRAALAQLLGELTNQKLGERPKADSHVITISTQQ